MTFTDKMVAVGRIEFTKPEYTEEELKAIDGLVTSIMEQGLLHPITLEAADETKPETSYRLVAGGKRFVAWQTVAQSDLIPARIAYGPLTDKQRKEIHIRENLQRSNLPWWDQVVLVKELHELRQGEKGVGRSGKKTGWSLRDTASELDASLGAISQDIRLAEAVLQNPNLKKITDKSTARRLVFNEYKRIEQEVEAGLTPEIDVNQVYHGDSSTVMAHFPANTFDACFTDPPWIDYKDPKLTRDAQTLPVFKELYRVLKGDAFLYVICSTPDFVFYLEELTKIGFKCQQMPLIWVKTGTVSHGNRAWEYNRDYEPILLAVKGAPVLTTSNVHSSVYTSSAIHNTRSIHPNEKPFDVPAHFLQHCTYEGSMVIDPFGGSGATAEACIRLKLRYVTIERDKEFYDNIVKRLAGVKL